MNPVSEAFDALRRLRCIDLTYPLEGSMPFYPGRNALPFERVQTVTLDVQGVNSGRISMGEHTGTHLDAPVHFIDGQISAEAIPVAHLLAPAVVIDITAATDADADHRLTAAAIITWEDGNGPIPAGSFVLVRTGWGRRWGDADAYINQDGEGVLHYPAITPEAARRLVDLDVLGVGIDTLSADNAAPSDVRSPAHKVLHGAGRYVMENLANLEDLPDRDILLMIGALPVVGGTAGAARVLAFVE